MIFTAKLDGEIVYVLITDLTAFVHAAPASEVCVYDAENNASLCFKSQLQELEAQT